MSLVTHLAVNPCEKKNITATNHNEKASVIGGIILRGCSVFIGDEPLLYHIIQISKYSTTKQLKLHHEDYEDWTAMSVGPPILHSILCRLRLCGPRYHSTVKHDVVSFAIPHRSMSTGMH